MLLYTVHHKTVYEYPDPVTETVMEVRMQPRSDGLQRCLTFDLATEPETQIFSYRDFLGNVVHHFDIPGHYTRLEIRAGSRVECLPAPVLPPSLPKKAWSELDALVAAGDYWDMLLPSRVVSTTPQLALLAADWKVKRRGDPLSLIRELCQEVHRSFAFEVRAVGRDVALDDVLESRRGMSRDFTHVLLALLRELRIPSRYVSGYVFHRPEDRLQSVRHLMHAWVEALLPRLGWIGFDPTNDVLAGERHIRCALGRDYADVPPTRGVCKGGSDDCKLSVSVDVTQTEPSEGGEVFSDAEQGWLPFEKAQ